MNDESRQQLRRFAESGAQDAFAAVVEGFLPLVYGAALRRVAGNVHCAEDVTQLVFMAVARNAPKLARHPDLTGWLFTTTRFLAAKTLRGQRRRQAREQEAYMTQPPVEEDGARADLPRLIDDLVMELRELDRQVILLRFHRGMRLVEIAAHLASSENAVQKRLDRTLDQLKAKLARRGITSTAAALVVALAQQAVVAMPAGLATTVTSAGLACGAGLGGLLAGSSFMMVSKLQVGITAAIVATSTIGLVWEVRENAQLRSVSTERASLNDASVAALKSNLAALTQRATAAEVDATAMQAALQAARSTRVTEAPTARVLTDAQGQATAAMARASKLRNEGRPQEALDEYLTCYRTLPTTGPGAVYRQILMGRIKSLGQPYPAAITALRELRDTAMQKLEVSPGSRELILEVGQLNERLGDGRASMTLYDFLPPGDPGRQALGLIAHGAFVEARRYDDALIGKTPGNMLNELDMGIRRSGQDKAGRDHIVKGALSNIEVLTGVGKLDDARILTAKLLAFDGSEATHVAIQKHVDRARPPVAR